MFLWNAENPKSKKSSEALPHNGSYTYADFSWILTTIKMKFGQILVCCMTNIQLSFWLDAGDWKLVPGPFMILLKQQDNKILPFFIVDFYHFNCPLFTFSKNETMESWHNCLLSNWSWLLNKKGNLAPILQIVQKISENYCPRLYLSIGQFGDLMSCGWKHLFKNTPCLVYWYSSWHHRLGKLWDG